MVCRLPLFPRQGLGFIDNLTEVVRQKAAKKFGVTDRRNTPLSSEFFLEVFDEEEPTWSLAIS